MKQETKTTATQPKDWREVLRRLDNVRWELPTDYMAGMRVPGLIFADDALMETMATDQAVAQVANVATLPGIVGHSIAMPDIHWGYGFPIGGVAATRVDEGVVSPGGVGLDVNCVSYETTILHRLGYVRLIGDVVSARQSDAVRCYEIGPFEIQSAPVDAFLAKRPTSPVLEMRTASGRSVVATSDHPFLTPSGMLHLGALRPG